MTLDILKSQVLGLNKLEMLDFARFLLEKIKEKETIEDFQLSKEQIKELELRLKEISTNPEVLVSGIEAENQLIKKYGLKL